MNLREAAQMALDALQENKPIDINDPTAFYRSAHAIEALRAALAQPKPPIIEEWYLFHGGNGNFFVNDKFLPNVRFTFDPDTKMPIKVELI
jgi:hypothetical protein